MLPAENSKRFQLSQRDVKAIVTYILIGVATYIVGNEVVLENLLGLYLPPERVTLIVWVTAVVFRKLLTDYSNG